MAHYNPKDGIVLTEDDRKELNHKGRGRLAESIINKIIWGDKEHYYSKEEINESNENN